MTGSVVPVDHGNLTRHRTSRGGIEAALVMAQTAIYYPPRTRAETVQVLARICTILENTTMGESL